MIHQSISPFRPGQHISSIRQQLETMRRGVLPVATIAPGRGIAINQTSFGTIIHNRRRRSNNLPSGAVDRLLGIVTGSLWVPTEFRFKYAWSEVEFLHTGTLQAKEGGRTGTTDSGFAYSMAETFHTDRYQAGTDIQGTSYADTNFQLMPLGGGGADRTHKYDVPVILLETYINQVRLFWIETVMGTHDGNC